MGKTIVITGGSDGIGAEAARQLTAAGHKVIIVGRTPAKVQKVAAELGAPYHIADYSRLSDVVRLAGELEAYERIDVLANNAGGIMKAERAVTEDGFEMTFQVNVLAQHLLTRLLIDKLSASHATVIQTASIASKLFGRKLDLSDIHNEKAYTSYKAYGEGKLGDILFTRELNRRYEDINAVAFEPGIPRTNFAADGPLFFKFMYHSPFKYLFTCSQKKSAKRLIRLAVGEPGVDFVPGATYSYKKQYNEKFGDDGTIARAYYDACEAMLESYLNAAPAPEPAPETETASAPETVEE